MDFTISEIFKRRPHALSLAIVPVGVTRHRRDKFELKQFDKVSAAKVIEQVEIFQKKSRAESGRTFVYLGDEFYFIAEKDFPPAEFYDGFPQIENGIGMTRNFIDEFHSLKAKSSKLKAKIDIVCGTSIAKVFRRLTADMPNVRIVPVTNKFFGERVNVSGLLTGGDIIDSLKTSGGTRDVILIPSTALKSGEEIFLDDVTVDELRKIFAPAKVLPIHDGAEFKRVLNAAEI